jgi:phosphoribosylamine--glycine ligase
MKVLLVSSSARGHAIAEALVRSRHRPEIISVSPQINPGIAMLTDALFPMDIMDFESVLAVAKKTKPDFAVIGPDDPIGAGLADRLTEIGIESMAPKKALAQIEASKGFARELMEKHGIDASPKFRVFGSGQGSEMNKFVEQELHGDFVVKYDGLKGGKGVKVSGEHFSTTAEGIAYAEECIAECGRVVIEEKLVGVEFSLLSFVSGTKVVDMPAVQDHKRAYDGDTGPNTGGMGTYSDSNHSLPFLSTADLSRAKEINRKVAAALEKECGEPYTGILYGGFMAVRDGIRVIEYNARFGDPEALNILPLLSSDFVEICQAIISGELNDDLVTFEKKATVCKYITPKSYPEAKKEKGESIEFPKPFAHSHIFYGDVSRDADGGLHLGGSRTAGIVGVGDTIESAEKIAQPLCEQVKGPVRFRWDIGTKTLIQKRIEMMRSLRS